MLANKIIVAQRSHMKTTKTATLRIRCEPEIKRHAEKIASQHDLELSDIVRRALRLYLKQATAARRASALILPA